MPWYSHTLHSFSICNEAKILHIYTAVVYSIVEVEKKKAKERNGINIPGIVRTAHSTAL